MCATSEFICIDATYELLDEKISVFIKTKEIVNWISEIVAVCLLVDEDAQKLQWTLPTFKENNPD